MTRRIGLWGSCFLIALAVGTLADTPKPSVARELGGYQVLAADLHVHSFPFSWSMLSPCDTAIEARHQGLDVIAMTPHNHVWVAKVGRWCSRMTGGPIVLVGEEIVAARYHLLAIGISDVISHRLSTEDAIDDVHRQGGVAIAAHPYASFVPAYDASALRKLDGSEVVRPESWHDKRLADQLRDFFGRAPLVAIGSTDFHGLEPAGYIRTYIFSHARTDSAILDAIREGRTVVYGRERVYGDPTLVALATSAGGLPHDVPQRPAMAPGAVFSRIAGVLALCVVLLRNRW